MSTFLALATSLCTECGVTPQTTVANATGEWARMVNWIKTAWTEIQIENPDFGWMRKSVSFNTVAQQGEYLADGAEINLTDFGSWREQSFRLYLQTAGEGTEQLLGFKEYNDFRDYYLLASRKTTYARPTEVTVTPSKSLMLGLKPDAVYVVSGEYYTAPVELAADADTPLMPERYHKAIVYKAMMHYGAYESAAEVYAQGKDQYNFMMNRIRSNQLPDVTRGRSMI